MTRRIAALALAMCACGAGAVEAPGNVRDAFERIAAEADSAAMGQRFKELWGTAGNVPVVVHDAGGSGSWWRNPDTGAIEAFALRSDQPPANTCIDADTVPRVLLLLPLPEEAEALAALVWHERWHCVQRRLDLAGLEGDNAHLDDEGGRTWLRQELRALSRALEAGDDAAARRAAADALAFRAHRSAEGVLGTGALREEAKLERNEGLAEYSGRVVAAGDGDPVPAIVDALRSADAATSFVRSMAYATGPAYGLLLDRWAPGWRVEASPDLDLPLRLARAIGVGEVLPDVERAGSTYGLEAVRGQEAVRAAERAHRSAAYRERFVEGEVLRLPLRNPSVSFDPRTLFPMGGAGTVYAPATVRDGWGELSAPEGALVAADWSQVSVGGEIVEGCASAWHGAGWTLTLSAGWRVERDLEGWRIVEGKPESCPR